MDKRKKMKLKMESKNTRIKDGIWKGIDGRKEGWTEGRTDRQTDT
jgi:hypothetical protein